MRNRILHYRTINFVPKSLWLGVRRFKNDFTVLHSLWMFVCMRHRFKPVIVLNSEPDTKILPLHNSNNFYFLFNLRGNVEDVSFCHVRRLLVYSVVNFSYKYYLYDMSRSYKFTFRQTLLRICCTVLFFS
jgi:hypothetical protein